MADARRSPIDQALNLFVFAPIGLALTAKDELPKLIDKGRQRTNSQLTVAKMIGQFAVTQGQQEVSKRVAQAVTRPARPQPTPSSTVQTGGAAGVANLGGTTADNNGTNGTNGNHAAAPSTGPGAGLLAIPGYDSLSASQVVQRLAGLSASELDAVGDYEQQHRGRRTILSKVNQLQTEHP
jgi:hypothetical protein